MCGPAPHDPVRGPEVWERWVNPAMDPVMGFSRGTHTGQIRLHLILHKMITSISGAMFSSVNIVECETCGYAPMPEKLPHLLP